MTLSQVLIEPKCTVDYSMGASPKIDINMIGQITSFKLKRMIIRDI